MKNFFVSAFHLMTDFFLEGLLLQTALVLYID